MKRRFLLPVILFATLMPIAYYMFFAEPTILSNIKRKEDISKLFPKQAHEITYLVANTLKEAQEKIDAIIAIKPGNRTFENTAKALDNISLCNASILYSSLSVLKMLSPQEDIRKAAEKGMLEMQKFWIDAMSNNVSLYKSFKTYADHIAPKENLSEEQRYFIEKRIKAYKHAGLDLPEEKQQEVKRVKKELGTLGLQFATNIAESKNSIAVSQDQLKGLDTAFIDSLEKDSDGNYILGVDYPTYFNVMENCEIEETRKKLYLAFNNRAYPENDDILRSIIQKRDELAKLLGFASYAHLDLDDQMAHNPETAQDFLDSLYEKASHKEAKEFELLIKNLPQSVTLTEDKKIKAWDLRYIKNQYKKKHLAIDEQKIAEYFPAKETIDELLKIYEQFLQITFKISDMPNLWHQEVKLVEVHAKKDNELLGYLLLDLYPRDNKYNHACKMTIIPSIKDGGPAVCIVITNFPKATTTKPSLLTLQDVETFFHEFGHALHAILGKTAIASFSGTNVKTDFVEVPSQMLEEWLSDKEILKQISGHYKTGVSLPDETIDKIIKLKKFDSGDSLQRQCYLSCLALNYFNGDLNKNPKTIYQKLTKAMRPHIAYDPNDNMFASFGHLSGYGAKYYSYMWSKVFALDMFSEIKKHGLLNPDIGQKYVEQVLSKGGSQDPNKLLETFLGRKPNENALLDNLGLN
ncbi:M3 family metallopeptidase [Candidatus Dependentiae bacterium]